MNQVWKIVKWEFINRIKTKLFIITTFVLPIFMYGIMYLPSILMDLEPEEERTIGLIFSENNKPLIERFKNQALSTFRTQNGDSQYKFIRFSSNDVALESILSKTIEGFIFIPENILGSEEIRYYSKSLSDIKIYSNLRSVLNKVVIEQRMINQEIDVSIVSQLSERIQFNTYEINDFGEAAESDGFSSFVIPYLFLMILFMTVFMSGQLLLRSVMEERTSRTIEILLSSVTPKELMSGKILGLGALGLAQIIFYLIAALSITYYKNLAVIELSQIPFFLIYFISGYLFYASIFAAMGTFFSSEQEAQQSSGIISLIAIIPIAFASYFITNPSSSFTIGTTYFPPLTPFMMIIRLGTDTVGIGEIFYTTILMIISCWIMLIVSGRVFQTAILLYGKKVTLKEVIKWIRI